MKQTRVRASARVAERRGTRAAARGRAYPAAGMPAAKPMDLFATARARRSVRVFLPQAVEPEQIKTILETANLAPSAGNLQAYEIYVVTDRTARERLVQAAGDQPAIAQAPVALVFCAYPHRSAERYGPRGHSLYCVQDATIACAYAQLAATALGLATVWVGAFDEDAARHALGIESTLRPVAILPVGHAGERPAAAPRRSLTSLTHYITAPQELPGSVVVRAPATGLMTPPRE